MRTSTPFGDDILTLGESMLSAARDGDWTAASEWHEALSARSRAGATEMTAERALDVFTAAKRYIDETLALAEQARDAARSDLGTLRSRQRASAAYAAG